MHHRYLGNSGVKVSAISYGSWITHGNQIDDDLAVGSSTRRLAPTGRP